jgi:hypothetical protein
MRIKAFDISVDEIAAFKKIEMEANNWIEENENKFVVHKIKTHSFTTRFVVVITYSPKE